MLIRKPHANAVEGIGHDLKLAAYEESLALPLGLRYPPPPKDGYST
jgi:hypothetical protein